MARKLGYRGNVTAVVSPPSILLRLNFFRLAAGRWFWTSLGRWQLSAGAVTATDTRMGAAVATAVIARHLARLQLFHLRG